jgi:hypothetical protein
VSRLTCLGLAAAPVTCAPAAPGAWRTQRTTCWNVLAWQTFGRGTRLYVAAAAATVTSAGSQAATRALFRPSHFAEVANYPLIAKCRRFAADGADHMMAVAAGLTWRGAGDDATTAAVSESSSEDDADSPSLLSLLAGVCLPAGDYGVYGDYGG